MIHRVECCLPIEVGIVGGGDEGNTPHRSVCGDEAGAHVPYSIEQRMRRSAHSCPDVRQFLMRPRRGRLMDANSPLQQSEVDRVVGSSKQPAEPRAQVEEAGYDNSFLSLIFSQALLPFNVQRSGDSQPRTNTSAGDAAKEGKNITRVCAAADCESAKKSDGTPAHAAAERRYLAECRPSKVAAPTFVHRWIVAVTQLVSKLFYWSGK